METEKITGLIHLYCGDGQGKTTAALGLALRFAGYGLPVTFVQFQKNTPSGELNALKLLPTVRVLRAEDGLTAFPWEFSPEEAALRRRSHDGLLRQALALCAGEGRCLLVLDELCGALNDKTADEALVLRLLQSKPDAMELVITGRRPSEELLRAADYITEMKAVRHPMERGIPARPGVEF